MYATSSLSDCALVLLTVSFRRTILFHVYMLWQIWGSSKTRKHTRIVSCQIVQDLEFLLVKPLGDDMSTQRNQSDDDYGKT